MLEHFEPIEGRNIASAGSSCLGSRNGDSVNKVESVSSKLRKVRFLVTVNDTWADPPGCIATIATPQVSVNRSEHITVGACDHGPINYTFLSPGMNYNKYTVSLTFYSSVIEDASPPTCDLSWNGTYLVPKSSTKENPDLLPSCFTTDSREGHLLTYYWFQLLDWEFE